MNSDIKPTNPKKGLFKKISFKNVLIAFCIVFFFFTTLLFGLLYYSNSNENTLYTLTSVSNEEKIKEEVIIEEKSIEEEETGIEETCDFDLIKEAVLTDSERYHLRYSYILETNPSTNFIGCKKILKTNISKILDTQKEIDGEELEDIKLSVEADYISYLIDDSFVIYHVLGGNIWEVDIREETLELLWSAKESEPIMVPELYVIGDNNISRIFFKSTPWGLGGGPQDAEGLETIRKELCENRNIGTWMYETSTGKATLIADAELCI